LGRSRGGLTTKIHALVDKKGRPIKLKLTAGQASDVASAAELIADLPEDAILIADKGYDANALREAVAERGGTAARRTGRPDVAYPIWIQAACALSRGGNLTGALRATDAEWTHGTGPEVSGPILSLVMAMTGRKVADGDLTGEGLETLRSRS